MPPPPPPHSISNGLLPVARQGGGCDRAGEQEDDVLPPHHQPIQDQQRLHAALRTQLVLRNGLQAAPLMSPFVRIRIRKSAPRFC